MKKKMYGLTVYDCNYVKYDSKYRLSKDEIKFFKNADIKKDRLDEKIEFLRKVQTFLKEERNKRLKHISEKEPFIACEEDNYKIAFDDFILKTLFFFQSKIDNKIARFNKKREIYNNFIDNSINTKVK